MYKGYTVIKCLPVLNRELYLIAWKLLVLDKNTWNHWIVYELFVLDRNNYKERYKGLQIIRIK